MNIAYIIALTAIGVVGITVVACFRQRKRARVEAFAPSKCYICEKETGGAYPQKCFDCERQSNYVFDTPAGTPKLFGGM